MFKKLFEKNETNDSCIAQMSNPIESNPIEHIPYLLRSIDALEKELYDLKKYLGVSYCESKLVKNEEDENEKRMRLFDDACIKRIEEALNNRGKQNAKANKKRIS
jgi:hypothetical protein